MHRRMVMMTAAMIACVISSISTYAAQPKSVILGRSDVPDHGMIALDATKSISDRPFKWEISGPDTIVIRLPGEVTRGDATAIDPKAYILIPDAVVGTYKFKLTTVGMPEGKSNAESLEADAKEFTVVVSHVEPPVVIPPVVIPPIVNPPTPTPTPQPTPTPAPTPTPQIEPGKFRVVLLRETSQPITFPQQYAIDSIAVAQYLNEKTMVDGTVHAWRRYDPQAVVVNETPTWQTAMTNARNDKRFQSVPNPKAIVFNGETPVDFLLINDEPSLLAALKVYGGP